MSNAAKNLAKIIGGIILLVIAAWIIISFESWLAAIWSVIQGIIVILIVLIGLALIVLGGSDVKG